jgi:hypothetical protein
MAWFDQNWDYRNKVTIDKDKVSTNQTDFTVYVDLSDFGNDFWNNVKSDGGDIRVTSDDGTTQLPVDVISINIGTKKGILKLKTGSLSASVDTDIYVYYGNAVATQPAPGDTYGQYNAYKSDIKLSANLEESGNGTADEFKDRTSNQNHGQGGGGTPADVPAQVTGKIGKGQDFDGSTDYINMPDDNSLDITGTLTLSCWVKAVDWDGNGFQFFFGKTDVSQSKSNYSININNDGDLLFSHYNGGWRDIIDNSGATYSDDTWYHIAVTVNETTNDVKFYRNGILLSTRTITYSLLTNTVDLRMGDNALATQEFEGVIDEARISTEEITGDWLLTEYNNQNSPSTFYTIGSQEGSGGAAKRLFSNRFNPFN